jgi:hypothetical protein
MAKGTYIYDPEKKEFRTRGGSAAWAMDGGGPHMPSLRRPKKRRRRRRSEKAAGAATPRRKRRSSRESEGEIEESLASSPWRPIMWAVIVVMTLVWLVVVFSQQNRPPAEGDLESIFKFDREELPLPHW